jgi:hypothetical protein
MFHREDDELRKLREEWPNMTYEDKVDRFLWKMVWFHHEKHIPGAPPHQAINRLAEMLDSAAKSSDQLTKSIRTATWVGGIAASVGVLVAIVSLLIK